MSLPERDLFCSVSPKATVAQLNYRVPLCAFHHHLLRITLVVSALEGLDSGLFKRTRLYSSVRHVKAQ